MGRAHSTIEMITEVGVGGVGWNRKGQNMIYRMLPCESSDPQKDVPNFNTIY